jgi:hypothetical protein
MDQETVHCVDCPARHPHGRPGISLEIPKVIRKQGSHYAMAKKRPVQEAWQEAEQATRETGRGRRSAGGFEQQTRQRNGLVYYAGEIYRQHAQQQHGQYGGSSSSSGWGTNWHSSWGSGWDR